MSSIAAWLPRHRVLNDAGAPALVCMPYAGGGASLYRQWPAALQGRIDVIPLQPPGREERLTEPPIWCWREMVAQMAEVVEPLASRPLALFGYSMGGMLAYELARALRRRGVSIAHLFVAAAPAPHLPPSHEYLHLLSDARLTDWVRALGGTPLAVLNHPEMMQLLLPTLRADFAVLERHRHVDEAPLECPITVFGGAEDPEAPSWALSAWRDLTNAETEVRIFPGAHFFIDRHEADLIARVATALEDAFAPTRRVA